MATLPVRSLALLTLATLVASPAFAEKGGGKKAAEIKALEGQIHQLRDQEKAAIKAIDEHFAHIIRNMDPKEVHNQLEEILGVLHQVKDLLSLHGNGTPDHLNYDDYRAKAHESIDRAEHQVDRALHHDTAEERARAGHDIGRVHEDLSKALAFSREHPDAVDGKSKEDLERRAVENQHLTDALPKIEMAHHLLMAVDHEITDYQQEKHDLRAKRNAKKEETKKQFRDKIKALEEQIAALKK